METLEKTPVLLAAALALAGLAAVPSANARQNSQSYVTGADVVFSCRDDIAGGLLDLGAGSVCFFPRAGESTVSLQIQDDVFTQVGAEVGFQDGDGDLIGELRAFCGSSGPLAIPQDAARIEVFVNGPVIQAVECSEPASSTAGDVVATFS